jgi:hypothetical protein
MLGRIPRKRLTRPVASGLALAAAGALTLGGPAAGATGTGAGRPTGSYAITFARNSALYRLNPGRHTATLAGFAGVTLTDVAFRGRTLYAISFTTLYRLSTRTGAAHQIGPLGLSSANALATQPQTNTLYGADRQGDLFRVNARTGRSAIIGRFGRGLGSAGDLTFAHGRLYATVDRPGSTWSLLATVNIRTGAAKVIGPTGYQDVYGLLTSKGAIYGATFGGKFLAISPRTGRGRVIWADGLAIGGLAAPTP